MSYVSPETVISPQKMVRNVTVLYDSSKEPEYEAEGKSWDTFSIARLHWAGDPNALGIRWNGGKLSSLGTPHSMGKPTWFIVPKELRPLVLDWLEQKQHSTSRDLLEGYMAMAADEEHEREAMEWSEGLIGDSAQG